MAQNNLSIIGAGGVKNLVSLGDFDQWLDQRVNDRFSGGGDIAKFYQAVPWLFRATMLRAQAIASFPFDIVAAGSTEPLDPEEYATVLDFIPDLTTKLWLLEASLTLTGKAYLRNLRNRIYIKEVRYYAPTTITPKYDKATGELVGYTRKANGQVYELTPDEITAFWYPDPFSEIGEPTHYPAQAARAASGVMFNLALFQELFFGRGAIKASVISAPANTQEKERKRLKDWFQSMFFGGINTAHTVEVVNADAVKVTTIGEGVKELENTNLSQEKREDIAAALTIPQTMLFSGSAAGLGGGGVTDADDIRFVNEFKIPEFRFVANLLNRGVLVPNGYKMIPMPERLDALHDDEAALAATASTYADLLDKCADYETWEALAAMTGIEYDETQFKKVFVLKESRRADSANAEAARLEAQRAQMQPANMTVTKPEPAQITAGDNAKAIGGGHGLANGNDSNPNVAESIINTQRHTSNNLLGGVDTAHATKTIEQKRGGDATTSDLLDRVSVESNRIPVAPSPVDSAAKALERKQYRTWAGKATNAGKVFTFNYLDADEQAALMLYHGTNSGEGFTGMTQPVTDSVKKKNVKALGDAAIEFCGAMHAVVEGYFDRARSDQPIGNLIKNLIDTGVANAYYEGLAAAGVEPEDYSDEDTQAVDDLTFEQLGHADGFIDAVVAAKADKELRDGVIARIDLWCNSIQQIGDNARNGATDGMFEFMLTGDASEESCETCQKLLGKKHRWSWVVKNGYEVKAGNENFSCLCYRCPHSWEPVGKGG